MPVAPKMDFVFIVCDSAAAEECTNFPVQPMTAHWAIPDLAAIKGSEAEKAIAFAETYRSMTRRSQCITSWPFRTLGAITLKTQLADIG